MNIGPNTIAMFSIPILFTSRFSFTFTKTEINLENNVLGPGGSNSMIVANFFNESFSDFVSIENY